MIAVTLPDGTGMSMEVSVGCGSASVSIIDSHYSPVVVFDNVSIVGGVGFCHDNGTGADFRKSPGLDFGSN
jgi:hypothetical protein